MTDVKKEPTDAEIAAKTGFGETAEEAQEEATESEEETETTDTEEEAEESAESVEEEEAADDKPASRQKRNVSESEEEGVADDAAEESEEEETAEEEASADKDEGKKGKNRTVPYSLLKSKNLKIKKLEADLDDARAKKEEADKSGDDEAADESEADIAAAAKDLGEELGLDEAGISKILKAAVKISSKKSAIPKDIADKLKDLEDLKQQNQKQKEANHFNNEWDALNVKKQYPNASKSALAEAQELMDNLAHSKEHHQHDLDYVLFKNKSKFDTILKTAAKGKSAETSKRVAGDESGDGSAEDDGESMVDIEDLTPEIMRQRDARERNRRRGGSSEKEYTIHEPIRK